MFKARNIEFIAITVSRSYNCEFCAVALVLEFVSGIVPVSEFRLQPGFSILKQNYVAKNFTNKCSDSSGDYSFPP